MCTSAVNFFRYRDNDLKTSRSECRCYLFYYSNSFNMLDCLYFTAGNEVVSLPVEWPGHGPFLGYSVSVIQFNN